MKRKAGRAYTPRERFGLYRTALDLASASSSGDLLGRAITYVGFLAAAPPASLELRQREAALMHAVSRYLDENRLFVLARAEDILKFLRGEG